MFWFGIGSGGKDAGSQEAAGSDVSLGSVRSLGAGAIAWS